MLPILVSLWNWLTALSVVCLPFINMAALWLAWQTGIGWAAWSSARFYSNNCAPAGVSGFLPWGALFVSARGFRMQHLLLLILRHLLLR